MLCLILVAIDFARKIRSHSYNSRKIDINYAAYIVNVMVHYNLKLISFQYKDGANLRNGKNNA